MRALQRTAVTAITPTRDRCHTVNVSGFVEGSEWNRERMDEAAKQYSGLVINQMIVFFAW